MDLPRRHLANSLTLRLIAEKNKPMRIKQIIILLTIIMLEVSCATGQKTMTKEITVTVIDKKNSKPIDDAEVTLKTWTNSSLNNETKHSDPEGQCSFLFDFDESTNYQIFTRKKGYFVYHNIEENDKMESNKDIRSTTENNVILYLTSDPLPLINYYAKRTPSYHIDTLIYLLKTDNYHHRGIYSIPKLNWEDIPKLLEIGNIESKITNFPRNPVSSSIQKDCYLGIISLWLIESIRIIERDGLINPMDKFPSMHPYLIDEKNQTRSRDPNTVESMKTALLSYKNWWQTVKNMDKREACKISPVKETNLGW